MRLRLLAIVVLGVSIAMGPMAWARKWTSSDGQFSTEAKLVEYADGKVTLKKPSGETITLAATQLSMADRRFLATALWKPRPSKKGSKAGADGEPSYTGDIQPFLASYCLNCHNQKRAESGHAVDTFAALTRSTRRGALVLPGEPTESLLIQSLQPGRRHMPPKDSPQPQPEQISKVMAWISAGAKDDSADQVQPKARAETGKPRR